MYEKDALKHEMKLDLKLNICQKKKGYGIGRLISKVSDKIFE